MTRFKFRYETLHRHRQLVEDRLQRELAKLMRSRMILMGQLQHMQDTIRDARLQMTDDLVGTVDVNRIAGFAGFSQQVRHRGQQIVVHLAHLEKQIGEARGRLLDAVRQRKALDRLKERHHERWRREQQRRADLEMDEIAARTHARHATLETMP